MNTLNKTLTHSLFLADSSSYDKLTENWAKYINDPELRTTLKAEHFLAYAIFRGKDWRKGFTPITNSVKLANGLQADGSLRAAVYHLKSAAEHPVFAGCLKAAAGATAKSLC